MARCVLESLALKYRYVIEQAGEPTGRLVGTINDVVVGSQNAGPKAHIIR